MLDRLIVLGVACFVGWVCWAFWSEAKREGLRRRQAAEAVRRRTAWRDQRQGSPRRVWEEDHPPVDGPRPAA